MNASPKTESTLDRALRSAALRLAKQGIGNPRFEAGVLLAHVLGTTREDLLLHPEQELTDAQNAQFRELVDRRMQGEPVAYLTGKREFWSLEFEVNSKVLIPRPETEGIIEQLIRLAGKNGHDRELSILDLGTGSGILAVMAAMEFSRARVTAVDVSAGALVVAKDNALRHGVGERIEFLQWDFMQDQRLPDRRPYDFILSNPPYIPSEELPNLMPDVRDYEPVGALDGGTDGLAFYRKIIPAAAIGLKGGGYLIVEVGDRQEGAVADLITSHCGFEEISIHKDLSGMGRVVSARRAHG